MRHIRAGVVTLYSKPIFVSREHMHTVARTMSIAFDAGKCQELRHLVGGRLAFILTRAMEMECLWWQPARGAAQEVTYQTLHYHYDAFYPLAERLERGFSSITSDYELKFPVRCFTERPVENAATMLEMHALAKFVGRHFNKNGKVIRPV